MTYLHRVQFGLNTLQKLALLIFFALVTPLVYCQQSLFTTQQHFGVEEGLPQSYISGILQDKDGFIWLSTLDGFCRYDGRVFKTFRYHPNDNTGLSANAINNLVAQPNNIVTLYYSSTQADDFDMRTFKVHRNTIRDSLRKIPGIYWQTSVAKTPANCIFMMSNDRGIGWRDNATGKVFYASKANGLLQQDTISAITQSATDGRVYLVSEGGVQVSDASLKKFDCIAFATGIKKQPPIFFGETYSDYYSTVLLPGNRLGVIDADKLFIVDIDKKTTRVYLIPPSSTGSPANFSQLQADSKGHLYFTNYGRIFRLTEKGELKVVWENVAAPQFRISAFFIDRSDVLWVSVNAQGLLRIDLQASPFQSYKYKTNFISDIMELAGARREQFPPEWVKTEGSYFLRQAHDSKGDLYACFNWINHNEVYRLNSRGFQLLPHLPSQTINASLFTTPDDALWVFDITGPAFYRWKTPEAVPEKIPLDDASIKDVEMADVKYIGGYIWLSTYSHGLLQYQGSKRINRFAGRIANGNMPETLTEICPDPVDKNKFWVGSRGGGLILWDVQKGLQHVYTVDDGLPNNTIYCILPDKAGKIWCSSNKGIFRFDVKNNQVTAFEKTDGLPGNEFNRAHKFIFPDGRLAFGGLDGYTIFNPADFDIKNNTVVVPVLLTGLQVNSQVQDISNATSIIKEPLSTLSIISLPHDKNYLRFEFAAMLFNQPQKTRYRYQLKGADEGWIENGTNNVASYAALPPGHYTLRLNATDDNGLWSDAVKEIAIIIHPPFYATWWAWCLYVIIAAGLVKWYFTFRDKRIKAAQSLAFEKREAMRLREVDEVKDRFFTNITHEFRTPLTLIITPLEKLLKDTSLAAPVVQTLNTIQKNSRQLFRLINEFLDFSKLNDGQMKVKLGTGELAVFAADSVQAFAAAAGEKNISLDFFATGVEGLFLFDEEKWGKIIINLLGNALKFTPKNGKVAVTLAAAANGMMELEVKDSGPGIPLLQQQKIFDRFYQVDDSAVRNYGGTGIGLSLVKELAEIMNGHIELDSKPGSPTRFIVTVPVQKIEGAAIALAAPAGMVANTGKKQLDENSPLLLVVEDNEELRAFLIQSMGNHYRVIDAVDGHHAWTLILQELPDIIISDVMMPGQDGFDLCRLCKNDNRTAHIGFILLTSKSAHDAKMRGLENCADDYITKPFHLDELELRTANLLQLQQNVRAQLQAQVISLLPKQKLPEVTNPFLVQLYKEIDDRIDDAELGVDYLCKKMAMSRSTLNRKLKSLLGISTNDMVRQYRLQKAATLLSGGLDITTAAYKVGFSSPSYFSQCFKEQYGITPSDYVLSQS